MEPEQGIKPANQLADFNNFKQKSTSIKKAIYNLGNDLKQTAMDHINEANVKITDVVKEINEEISQAKQSQPPSKSLFEWLLKRKGPVELKNKRHISNFEHLMKEIASLQGALNKSKGDIIKITDLSQKVLSKIELLNKFMKERDSKSSNGQQKQPLNTHKLTTKIKDIQKANEQHKEDLLNLSGDGGEFSVGRNSHLSLVNDAIGHVWRGRINSLMDRIFIIETKALVTDSMVDFLKPLAKLDEEVARVLTIQNLKSNRAEETKTALSNALHLNKDIHNKELAGLPPACIKHYLGKLLILKDVIEKFNHKYCKDKLEALTKKEVDKFADAMLALNTLSEEFEKVGVDYAAAKEALNGTLGPLLSINAVYALPSIPDDDFLKKAKKELKGTYDKLSIRKKNIEKDIAKANTASDFEKLKERSYQLRMDVKTAQNIAEELQKNKGSY